MSEFSYMCFNLLWELYLGYREKRVFRNVVRSSLPTEVQDVIDEEAFARARAYSLDRVDFLSFKCFYNTVVNVGFVVFDVLELLWSRSEALVSWAGYAPSEALTSCSFVFLMSAFNTLAWMPLDIYFNFVLEEKHGFNRLTLGFFVKDRMMVFVSSQLAMMFLVFAAVKIVETGGYYYFVYLWVLLALVAILVNALYPDYIAPLFDTFSPLPEGELRNRIRALTSSVGFPLSRVYILDSSKRTSHSDAYHVGIYKSKRVVLFDTLLQGRRGGWGRGLSDEEVVAVLGHELGHWNCYHILKLVLVSLGVVGVILVVYGPTMKQRAVVKSFGLQDFQHPVMGLYFVFRYVLPPRVAFLSLGFLWVTRHLEAEADAFAGSLGLAPHLRRALVKVHRDNLLFPVHDWLFSLCYHNHPSLLERLSALDKYE